MGSAPHLHKGTCPRHFHVPFQLTKVPRKGVSSAKQTYFDVGMEDISKVQVLEGLGHLQEKALSPAWGWEATAVLQACLSERSGAQPYTAPQGALCDYRLPRRARLPALSREDILTGELDGSRPSWHCLGRRHINYVTCFSQCGTSRTAHHANWALRSTSRPSIGKDRLLAWAHCQPRMCLLPLPGMPPQLRQVEERF